MEDQYLIDKNRYDEDVKNGVFPEKTLIEKQVWESVLNRSMVLEAENRQLKKEHEQLCKKIDKLYADVDYLKKRVDNLLGEDK